MRHILRDLTLFNGQLMARALCGTQPLVGQVQFYTSNSSAPQPPTLGAVVIGDTFVTSPIETDCGVCSGVWFDRRRMEIAHEHAAGWVPPPSLGDT